MSETLPTIASTLADLLGGRRTATDVTEQVLQRIRDTEPVHHAYVHVDADGARAQAHDVDERRRRRLPAGPLDGIPIGVKDLIQTSGMPTTAGAPYALDDGSGPDRAGSVRRLRMAGAVLVGKHETNRFGWGICPPPTRNALDPAWFPGGSTAGGGVSVALGSSLAALGTDAGGSLRIPAALNGVVGFKAGRGAIPTTGVIPGSTSVSDLGVITRTCDDARILLDVLSATGTRDGAESSGPRPPRRVGVIRRYWSGSEEDVERVATSSLAELERAGAEIVELEIAELDLVSPAFLTIIGHETWIAHEGLYRTDPSLYPPRGVQRLEAGAAITAAELAEAHELREVVRGALERQFDEKGVDFFAGPTAPVLTKPLAELDLDRDLAPFGAFTEVANLLGLPAVSVPVGHDPSGRSVGFQLIGRAGSDRLLLRTGQVLQDARSAF
ncbi:amidase [Microbacterium capsulatum]|uniref:Amidase n=1 Tax=Microbacterium capsulatum TaxID=3041921 RepID=A0ABU0XD65_9MICO|nr:amidase [Microbacterium sp. ASV81]MDQ4212553.1 amidase [Microbacterium sp. ASV81]